MSHHSSFDDDVRRGLSQAMKEVFGEYPNGKLNAQDEGAIACAIGHENSVVKLMFPKPVAWIGFTPEQAVQLASDLIKHAKECGGGIVLSIPVRP